MAQELPGTASAVLGFAGSAFSSLLSVVTLTFVSLFLLIERPGITDWLMGFTRPQTEARWRPILDRATSAVATTLLGNAMISIVAGAVAGLSSFALGLPFPLVLAVIVGVLDLIPQLGTMIAVLILVLVGLTVSIPAAAAAVVIQAVYQQVENNVLYPAVFRRTVSLSPLTTLLAVMIGASLLGVVGAILAVPVAALTRIAVNEVARPQRARMERLCRANSSGPQASSSELLRHDGDQHRREIEE